jgi:hypothetical protein
MTASTTLGGRQPRAFAGPTLPGGLADALRRGVAVAMAGLVMIVLIGAIMAVNLGLGYEGYSSGGPDRPPLPVAPAPAPPPGLP